MIALKRMANFGWAFLICLAAIPVYFLNVYVGPLRTELREVDRQIESRKRQIAYLEAEMAARGSLQRLNQYNEVMYGYEPPSPDQYLAGETAIAQLGQSSVKRPPVLVSVASGDIVPSGMIGSKIPQLSDSAPAAQEISASLVDEARATEVSVPKKLPAKATAAATPSTANLSSAHAKKEMARTERMAAIDRQLLSDETLSGISVEAGKEQRGQ